MSPYDDKKAYFNRLEALSAIGNDDLGEEEEWQRRCSRAFFPSSQRPTHLRPGLCDGLSSLPGQMPSALVSGPDIIEATPAEQFIRAGADRDPVEDTSLVEETLIPYSSQETRATLEKRFLDPTRSQTQSVNPSTSNDLGMKRKKSTQDNALLSHNQIFRGLSFFYIPNNAVAPIRRMRIQSAMAHGAAWVRNAPDASHIIVDKDLKYKDIEVALRPMPSEKNHLVIVNENFPLDCISARQMLNPSQKKYQVEGIPESRKPNRSGETKELSWQAWGATPPLPLKGVKRNPKKSGLRSQEDTPPRNDGFHHSPRQQEEQVEQVMSTRSMSYQDHDGPLLRPSQHATIPGLHQDNNGCQDELSTYIQLAKSYQGPRLDDDEEELEDEDGGFMARDDAQETTTGSEYSDGEATPRRKRRLSIGSKPGQKSMTHEERFVCHKGGTLDSNSVLKNPNSRTIEVLQSMVGYYERTNDQWRQLSYRKAITLLKSQTVKIRTEEQAILLPGIGKSLAKKIAEIASTDKLEKLEQAKNDPLTHALGLFMGIYGVGNARATKWISQGFRTLDDIRHKADLTANQRIGLEHYDDLNARIPRVEMDELGKYVKNEAAQVDADAELIVGGSYRRGSSSSGDIDFIVTRKGTRSHDDLVPFLNELVDRLINKRFLTAVLASLHSYYPNKEGPGSKWHGCCVLPRIPGGFNDTNDYRPTWRRIDFLLVPESEYGAALIYFTGNDIFNRSLRLLASKKGMRLNQRGLYRDVLRGPGRSKCTEGELVEGKDEKRIFEILGVKWRPPKERWC